MANIVNPNLPADLPTDWTTSQYVSPNGSEVSLSQQHGYNYLMEQVNAAQTAVNTLAEQAQEAVSGLESGALTATATRSGTTVAITGPEDAVTVTFLAPADWTEGDNYTYNGTPITVTDLNGNPVTDGWKQGAVLTFQISGGVAYFVGGASGSFLPLSGGTMTGPAVGAPGGSTIPQFRNVYYGTEALTPGSSPLPEGTLYITPEMEYEGAGKRTCRFVVGTSTAGWTAADCDYLCDGTADDVEINAAIQALPSTGGEIVILDGTYNITATITMNKQNVVLKGNGPSTILNRSGTGYPTVNLQSDNCILSYVQFMGNNTIYQTSSNNEVMVYGDFCNVSRCFVNEGITGIFISGNNAAIFGNRIESCSYGIQGSSNNNAAIRSNTITNCSETGIYMQSGSNYASIYGNYCSGNRTGITISGQYNTISSNVCSINSLHGIDLMCKQSVCTGNMCFSNSSNGIFVESDCTQVDVTSNNCYNNTNGINNGGEMCCIVGNVCTRGTGQSTDYSSAQNTILSNVSSQNTLFVGNNIMGKNYVDEGTNNTWANNKFE